MCSEASGGGGLGWAGVSTPERMKEEAHTWCRMLSHSSWYSGEAGFPSATTEASLVILKVTK